MERSFYDNRTLYGNVLIELAKKDDRIVVVDADLMKASGSGAFRDIFPQRHYDVGIAEQNLIGFSAGLAAMGKIPFAASFACFLSQRGCDQIVNAVAYNQFNVKLIGSYAGLTSEKNGGTHISIEDISIFRSIPHFQIIDPADGVEFSKALIYAAKHEGPVYIRQNKGAFPKLFEASYCLEEGKSVVMTDGEDVGLITTGLATQEAVIAAGILQRCGISVRHIHVPFIKPLDYEEIYKTAYKTKFLVTVENHSVYGGLGSAVAEAVCERYPSYLYRLGLQDCFGETADLKYLIKRFGIDADSIVQNILRKKESLCAGVKRSSTVV